ncbi:MAG: flavodoxin-dependent (E)-4-hydroxy-3-methylbut-2-enyl-diphosphate synthase [Spirochaetota bacterium]
MERRKTNEVRIGDLLIGADHPIAVQTMWDAPVVDADAVLDEIFTLSTAGCDIIRFSIPDMDSLNTLSQVFQKSVIPTVADIHFDYTLAIAAMEAGASKIRINPGNIGARWKVENVIDAAKHHGCAIRIGVNGGSLPSSQRKNHDHVSSMLEVIHGYLELFEKKQFRELVVSLKDSRPHICYEVNKQFSQTSSIPLHLGLTEAGPIIPALVKSSLVLGDLLREGIGDTLRMSITGSVRDEVAAAHELLRACGRSNRGVQLISCPRCGRAYFDTYAFTKLIQDRLQQIPESITVAVMGCAVNGPGEAREADLGITGAGNEILLFKRGKVFRRVHPEEAEQVFLDELEAVIHEIHHD